MFLQYPHVSSHEPPRAELLVEFPMKACSDCCFSEGGHLFAAASNNTIAVYNTFTLRACWHAQVRAPSLACMCAK